MTAPLVRVVDHVPFEAAVTPAQALAYCRRVLVGWSESQVKVQSALFFTGFTQEPETHDSGYISIPMRPREDYYKVRMADACDKMVSLGFASKPSDVLRAMAAEVVT